MFCYSGNGLLSIKTGDFPLHQQKLQVRMLCLLALRWQACEASTCAPHERL